MHVLLQQALATLEVQTLLCVQERKLGEVLCFLHQTPNDLLLTGCKVAGSAQRKQRGALLQHGGVLLAQSAFTPALPGIAELSGRALSSEKLQQAITNEIKYARGWQIEPAVWSEQERQTIAALVPRYTSDGWNRRR
jgi:lipoate-protein ligase A